MPLHGSFGFPLGARRKREVVVRAFSLREKLDTEGVIEGSGGCEPLTDPTRSQNPHPRKTMYPGIAP
jgi:hypothetical protein